MSSLTYATNIREKYVVFGGFAWIVRFTCSKKVLCKCGVWIVGNCLEGFIKAWLCEMYTTINVYQMYIYIYRTLH